MELLKKLAINLAVGVAFTAVVIAAGHAIFYVLG